MFLSCQSTNKILKLPVSSSIITTVQMMTFLNTNQFNNTNCFTIENNKLKLLCSLYKSFSIHHLNIASLKKNFDNIVIFLATLSFNFNVICISDMFI